MTNSDNQIPPNEGQHVLEYVDAYLHDVLSAAQGESIAAHCEACAICRAALDEARKRQEIVAALPPVEAPEALIQATLGQIGRHRAARRRWVMGELAAAAVLLVAAGLTILYSPDSVFLAMGAKAKQAARNPAHSGPSGPYANYADTTADSPESSAKDPASPAPADRTEPDSAAESQLAPHGAMVRRNYGKTEATTPPRDPSAQPGYAVTKPTYEGAAPAGRRTSGPEAKRSDDSFHDDPFSEGVRALGEVSRDRGTAAGDQPRPAAPPAAPNPRPQEGERRLLSASDAGSTGGVFQGWGESGERSKDGQSQVSGQQQPGITTRYSAGPFNTQTGLARGVGVNTDGGLIGAVSPDERNFDIERLGEQGAKDRDKRSSGHAPGVQTWKTSSLVANSSRLMIGDTEELPLRGMQADVRIDGFRARVLLDCYYFNDRPRQLEGSFQLRLPSGASPFFFAFGQTVYRAAMSKPGQPVFFDSQQVRKAELQPDDIMAFRQNTWEQPKAARVVQKEKAAYAYREMVRQRVDPALMEWSGAGVFNCRVFPLAPQHLHRVVIGYDVDLVRAGDNWELHIDLPDTKAPCVVDISVTEAASEVTLSTTAERSAEGGRVFYHLSDAHPGAVAVQVHEPAPVMLAGTDPKTGSYFATRFRPELPPEEKLSGAPRAVFLVDASLSARPQQFGVWLELLRAALENNRDSMKQFAVLFFNVEAFWWQERFVDNTPENVDAVLKYADSLTVEGATDLGRALTEATAPSWLVKADAEPKRDFFLLSDGAATWGENDWSALGRIVAGDCPGAEGDRHIFRPDGQKMSQSPGPLFAYNTGFAGTEGHLLAQLAARSGGAVFSVVGKTEIAKAATAHRSRPWRIAGVKVQGGSDLLLAGRPEFVFPQQELLLVGRGTPGDCPNFRLGENGTVPLESPQVLLSLERGGITKTVATKIGRVLSSQLAARTYGQAAVGQLEELTPATDEFAAAYARHFRVPGQTCSLLMLDTEQDYARFHINPEEDAFVVKSKAVTNVLAQLLDSVGRGLADSQTAFLAWMEKLQQTAGVAIQIPEALRIAVKQMPKSAFVVATRPLVCKSRTRQELPPAVQELLASGRADYDAISAEAQRRLAASGPDDALRALSSLVEDRPGDLVVARDIAFSAMAWELPSQAYHLLRRTMLARPYEPQTYQQIAQCLEAMGQADLAMIYYELAYSGTWDQRFGDFHNIVALDYLRFLRRTANKLESSSADYAQARLATIAAQHDLKKADLLVTIAWNTDGTDVDLHVTEPSGEECMYSHPTTKSGGRISRDVTQGLGPEMYILASAPSGTYRIQAHYFAGDANRASARTKVYATIYEGWGTPKERVLRKALSLVHYRDMHDLATIVLGDAVDSSDPNAKPAKGDEKVDPFMERP